MARRRCFSSAGIRGRQNKEMTPCVPSWNWLDGWISILLNQPTTFDWSLLHLYLKSQDEFTAHFILHISFVFNLFEHIAIVWIWARAWEQCGGCGRGCEGGSLKGTRTPVCETKERTRDFYKQRSPLPLELKTNLWRCFLTDTILFWIWRSKYTLRHPIFVYILVKIISGDRGYKKVGTLVRAHSFCIVNSVLIVKAPVGAFNQKKALVGASSVIVTSSRRFVKSSSYH